MTARAWNGTSGAEGTFDHVERHDDCVLLFATRLSEGHHDFTYVVRATTPARSRPPRRGRTDVRAGDIRPHRDAAVEVKR